MNKADLIEKICDGADLTKAQGAKVVDTFLEAIIKSLADGEAVRLIGFGNFEVRERAARTARNPRTGEEIKVKATKVAVFKAGKALKEAVA